MRLLLVLREPCRIGEDVVGEVVVLVDEKIDAGTRLAGLFIQVVKLFHATSLLVHLRLDTFGEILCIDITEIVEFRVADSIQGTAVVAHVGVDDSKVEVDDEVLVVVGRGMLADVKVAIQPFEPVCRIDVVIMPEHGHGEALSESARADEEEELVGVLHLLDEPCLIDVIAVILPYGNEIHHPVGYAFHLSFSTVSFHVASVLSCLRKQK